MADRANITPEVLRELLEYSPKTGKLTWKPRSAKWFRDGYREAQGEANNWNVRYAGKEALTCAQPKGHLQGRIFDRGFLAHRVAWAIHYGEWPKWQIDHINGNPADNRIGNLRDVPGRFNQRNMKLSRKNTSGVSGVQYDKRQGRWFSVIGAGLGKAVYLGSFANKEDAIAARREGEVRYGYHPNHGRRA